MYIGKHSEKSKSPQKNKIGVMDFILAFTAVALIAFTALMAHIFMVYGSIPDTLCTCVFSVLGGECGIMGWIKTNKDKLQKRQWDKEDELTRKDEKENDI